MRPYKLKDYDNSDFENRELFREQKCFMCGHHLPINQSFKVGVNWIHNDNRICLALTLKHDLRGVF